MAEDGADLKDIVGVELTPRQEALKEMAEEILSDASRLVKEKHLSMEAKGTTNFWWTFFGTEGTSVGNGVSVNALSLQALSQGREHPDVMQRRQELLRSGNPETIQAIEENIRYQQERVFVGLSGLEQDAEARRVFGDEPADVVANKLLQDLGFLEQGKSLNAQTPNVRTENNGRVLVIPHPTKPSFVAEVRPTGQKYSGEPRISGFNLHYTVPSTQQS